MAKVLTPSRVLTITDSDSQTINTTIPYKADSSTQAYLVIHQQDDVLKNSVFFSNHQYQVPWLGTGLYLHSIDYAESVIVISGVCLSKANRAVIMRPAFQNVSSKVSGRGSVR